MSPTVGQTLALPYYSRQSLHAMPSLFLIGYQAYLKIGGYGRFLERQRVFWLF